MTTAGGLLVKIGAAKSKAKLYDQLIFFSRKQLTSLTIGYQYFIHTAMMLFTKFAPTWADPSLLLGQL